MTIRIRAAAGALAAAAVLAACANGGGTTGGATATGGATGGAGATETLTVFAAASLTETFQQLADRYEQDNPGVAVSLVFDGSSGLARQINDGAPADVFASADVKNMDSVVEAGNAQEPVPIASNHLQIAVPADNPGNVEGLADLADPEVSVALCQPAVPCGQLAEQVQEMSGVDIAPVTEESDVKSVLTKVRLNEVDAGLVYTTDVQAAGDEVRGIDLPADASPSTVYPMAVLTAAPNPEQAQEFSQLVTSDDGRRILREAGFAPPTQ